MRRTTQECPLVCGTSDINVLYNNLLIWKKLKTRRSLIYWKNQLLEFLIMKQMKSGKQLAKEKYANEYAKNNDSTFELLFPRNYEDFFKSINERDSLNTNEN
jgi:hypothetical protein